MLNELGEQLAHDGHRAEAGAALRAAVADGGGTTIDSRCLLAEWRFEHGDAGEADGLLQELWAERRSDIGVAVFVGELLEERGDLAAANRWLTAAAVRAERNFERQSPMEIVHLLLSRRRVRRAQGFVDDDLDMLATGMQLSLLGTLVGAA